MVKKERKKKKKSMADTIFFFFFYNYFLRISIDLEIKRLYPMIERKRKGRKKKV